MARTVACVATARREKFRGENKEEVDISALALHHAVGFHSFASKLDRRDAEGKRKVLRKCLFEHDPRDLSRLVIQKFSRRKITPPTTRTASNATLDTRVHPPAAASRLQQLVRHDGTRAQF